MLTPNFTPYEYRHHKEHFSRGRSLPPNNGPDPWVEVSLVRKWNVFSPKKNQIHPPLARGTSWWSSRWISSRCWTAASRSPGPATACRRPGSPSSSPTSTWARPSVPKTSRDRNEKAVRSGWFSFFSGSLLVFVGFSSFFPFWGRLGVLICFPCLFRFC